MREKKFLLFKPAGVEYFVMTAAPTKTAAILNFLVLAVLLFYSACELPHYLKNNKCENFILSVSLYC